jgi:predicted O-methyltransferase YrrM
MREPVSSVFPEIFAVARHQAAACPVPMGGAGDLDLIYWLAESSAAARVVETGVAYGWSSLAFLLSLRSRPGSKLISTDMPYPNLNNDRYVGCAVPAELRSQWRILRYADRQALPRALKELGTIDMCHYDSDKSYEGRMWAYPILWRALKRRGFLISDDIADNIAFREFADSIAVDPIVVNLGGKYIGVLAKPSVSQ